MKREDIFEFYRRLAEANPSPETELAYGNDYQLLVAVVLSAQATDVGVNKATRKLFESIKTPADMVALGEDVLKSHIKTIGLFNAKAKNVIALSEILVRDHNGIVPANRDALEKLPGVGRKTANVVMHRYRAGQNPVGGRKVVGEENPCSVPLGRASLADPAWPLYLQGAQTRMLALSGCRSVPVQSQNPSAEAIRSQPAFRLIM